MMSDSNSVSRQTACSTVLVVVLLAWIAAVGNAAEVVPPNEEAISHVQAGRTETARASWWGFDPEDATKALRAALNSAAKQVVVEKMHHPWIVATTIRLPSDKEIVFEPGVVVEAKRGEFRGKSDCLFLAKSCRNLTLRGEGATFRMHKSDYHKPPYALAEWRHALSIRGSEDVTVTGLTLAHSGGDGIYLGVGSNRATNRNITIRNVVCDGNNRQGISVITAENLLIEDCSFLNTRGTPPEAGIDFEPNHPEEPLVNCVLRNCRSKNNAGHAYHIYLGNMHKESPPISIRLENCTSEGCERYSAYVGVANREGKRTVRGSIEYVDCQFDGDEGAGVYIRGNEADGCRVRLERCEIIRRDDQPSRLAPITIEAPRRLDLDTGNIEIADCVIRDSLVRPPVALIASPLTGLRNVSGSVKVESPEGESVYTLDSEQLAEWFPVQGLVARIPRVAFDWRDAKPVDADSPVDGEVSTFRLRREAVLLTQGTAGEPVELAVKMEAVGDHTPEPDPITVISEHGKPRKLRPEIEEGQVLYSFTPEETGSHRIHWKGHNNETLRPLRCTEPIAILGEA
ncbi:MAG: right-handed parallel beta-helix repeat-containing protein, partial [Pirellulaceae bacterium]